MTGKRKNIFDLNKSSSKSKSKPPSMKPPSISTSRIPSPPKTPKSPKKRPGKKWARIEEEHKSDYRRSRSRSPPGHPRFFRQDAEMYSVSPRSRSPLDADRLKISIPLRYHEAIKAQFVNGNHVPVKVVRGKWTILPNADAYMTGYAHPLARDGSLLKVKVLVRSSDGQRMIQKIIPVTDLKLKNPSDVFNIIPRRIGRNEVGYVDPYVKVRNPPEWMPAGLLVDPANAGAGDAVEGERRSRSRSRSRSSRSSGYASSRSSSRSRSRSRSRSSSRSRSRSRSKSRSRSRSRSRSGSPKANKESPKINLLTDAEMSKYNKLGKRKRSRSLS